MAVMSPMRLTPQRVYSVSPLRENEVPEIMTSRSEIVELPSPCLDDEPIFVAVAKEVKESKLNLIWAIQNSGGRRICIIYVHVPAAMIPLMGGKLPASSAEENEVQAYREIEKQSMLKILDDYLNICDRMGVRSEKLYTERDCIEKGIVELITEYNIRKLVMGAASDKFHSRRMMTIRSKKALYVCENSPAVCHIQFICKGYLIHTRGHSLDRVYSPLAQQTPLSEGERSPHLRSQSVGHGQNQLAGLTKRAQELLRRMRSTNDGRGGSIASVSSPQGIFTPQSKFCREGISDDLDGHGQLKWSFLAMSPFSDHSSSYGPVSSPNLTNEGSENVLDINSSGLNSNKADLHHSSSPSTPDGGIDDAVYDKLGQAMAEAENARLDAYQEGIRRRKSQKEAFVAILRTKEATMSYEKEMKLRKDIEEELGKGKKELDDMKSQRKKVDEELRFALDQKSLLEGQIASTELMMKELEQKNISAMEMLEKCKSERDDLQMQRDNALRDADEVRKRQGDASTTHTLQLFSEFSFLEIEEATNKFNPSLKIGEGGYGSIYKGILRQTEVAIKTLHLNGHQGPTEFQQEVEILSKLRHPNLVTLIGACPESWTLVYEYLPNGSLEDRLSCKDNTPPLSWQTRIRIATELCSALVFLHSSRPHCIVHGDLKPSNVLLDANLVSKLGDFGISRILTCRESSNSSTPLWRTDPKGTPTYMDPLFFATGELTPKSDVYSFGIILLRLLTGRQALGLPKVVKCALDAAELNSILDGSAGDWPSLQARELACLALRCCEMSRNDRPDLCLDVWRILEPMRASCVGNNTFGLDSQGLHQPPRYFICPILQEVMQDPHVAADGYTYEGKAIRRWLESGHDTSPVTNSKLEHCILIPNHSLHSAIQDWLQCH